MLYTEDIEDGVGKSEESLYNAYGIEITEEVNEEVALILHGDLFSTYDVPLELSYLISDIKYIIQEEIF